MGDKKAVPALVKMLQTQPESTVVAIKALAQLEDPQAIKPLLEMSYSLLVQYADFPEIKGKYIIKVGGLSLLLLQKDMIEKISQVLGIALKSEKLAMMTDVDDLWKKYLGVLNLSDCYIEKEERGPTPEQIQFMKQLEMLKKKAAMADKLAMEKKAEQAAKQTAKRLNPAQIMRMAG